MEISDVISTFNFAGDGVSSSVVDDVVTVTIPGTITVQEEGVNTSTTVRTLNFVGAATASGGAATATITVPAATITTQEEGVALSSTVNTMNFVGAGVTAAGAGATTTVTIPGGGSGSFAPEGFTTTVTAAGTTTLDNTSTYQQFFTGSSYQNVVLPAVATIAPGWSFMFVNQSTGEAAFGPNGAGTVEIRTSGGLCILRLPGRDCWATVTCVDVTLGTSPSGWISSMGVGTRQYQGSTGVYPMVSGSDACVSSTGTAYGPSACALGADSVAIGVTVVVEGTGSVGIGKNSEDNSIVNAIVINTLTTTLAPTDAAHALALGLTLRR